MLARYEATYMDQDDMVLLREECSDGNERACNTLERLCDDDEGRRRVQQALDRLLPYALTIFAPVDDEIEERIDELGLRTETLADMREEWLDTVVPYLEGLGLEIDEAELPEQYDTHHEDLDLPEEVGRDTSHTDDWDDLWNEFTNTYRELDRHEATRIMKDPDEVE